MRKSSINILEGLAFAVPDIRNIYSTIDLSNVKACPHKEIHNIVKNFSSPVIIIIIGIDTHCLVIEQEKKNSYHVIDIGSEVLYKKMKKGEIKTSIINTLKCNDFINPPFVKKIVVASAYENYPFDGDIYYNWINNKFVKNVHPEIEVGTDNLEFLNLGEVLKHITNDILS